MNYSEPQDPLPLAVLVILVVLMFIMLMGKAFAYDIKCSVTAKAGLATEFKFFTLDDMEKCKKNPDCELFRFIIDNKSELYKRMAPNSNTVIGFAVPYTVNVAVTSLIDDADCE